MEITLIFISGDSTAGIGHFLLLCSVFHVDFSPSVGCEYLSYTIVPYEDKESACQCDCPCFD